MNWSSPVRKSNDGRTLSPIPNEIYTEIFNYIRHHPVAGLDNNPLVVRNLRSLALVCRLFCATILPWLFESICFDGNASNPNLRPIPQFLSLFVRQLLMGTARVEAQYVIKCEFLTWPLEGENIHQEFLATCAAALVHMPNIREITLKETAITKGLLKSISQLKNLSKLTLDCCTLADHVKTSHLKKLTSLNLKYLYIDSSPSDILQYINLDTVLDLTLINVRDWATLFNRYTILSLETFRFVLDDPCELELVSSLRTPFLRSLSIDVRAINPEKSLATLEWNINELTQLSTVECPAYLLRFLIPGRPVTTISIPNSIWRDINVEYLQQSLRPISCMFVSNNVYSNIPLWKYFPDLEVLQIYLQGTRNVETSIRDIVNSWPQHPKIKSFKTKLDYSPFPTLLCEREWITSYLAPHFPTLKQCQFNSVIQWSYSDSDRTWKPTVIPDQVLSLLSLLEDFAAHPGGECFAESVAFKQELKELDPAGLELVRSRHLRRNHGKQPLGRWTG